MDVGIINCTNFNSTNQYKLHGYCIGLWGDYKLQINFDGMLFSFAVNIDSDFFLQKYIIASNADISVSILIIVLRT